MNKRSLTLFFFLALAVGGALYFTNLLQSPILRITHLIKAGYLDTIEAIDSTVDEHFNQQRAIIDLRRKNRYYESELLKLHQVADDYLKLLSEQNSSIQTAPNTELVRALSYVRFGDPHKLWIEMDDYNVSQVYGLLHKGYAAGIVVSKDDKPIALLNGDPKCSYAVNVGASMAPGIIRGNNTKRLIVEFIPTWIPISVGDLVTTSGLDRIFLSGLKVGKVVSISKAQGYQSAVVEPFVYGTNPAYFHVITKVR